MNLIKEGLWTWKKRIIEEKPTKSGLTLMVSVVRSTTFLIHGCVEAVLVPIYIDYKHIKWDFSFCVVCYDFKQSWFTVRPVPTPPNSIGSKRHQWRCSRHNPKFLHCFSIIFPSMSKEVPIDLNTSISLYPPWPSFVVIKKSWFSVVYNMPSLGGEQSLWNWFGHSVFVNFNAFFGSSIAVSCCKWSIKIKQRNQSLIWAPGIIIPFD